MSIVRYDDPLVHVESLTKHFADVKLVAKGGFGVIYSGIHKLDGNRYAIKHMRAKVTSKLFQRQIAEIRMLSCIYHPNIVRYHNSWVEEQSTNKHMNLFMQMELFHHTLESYLAARYDDDGRLGPYTLDIAFGLVEAVHFLHVHMHPTLIHGDITPSNIMLQYVHEHCIAKLCDFGLACAASPAVEFATDASSTYGTITYQAPEYHTAKTTSVDIYSLGIVLFQLFCSFASAMERCDLIRRFKTHKTKTNTLIDDTILTDYTQRPTIDQIRQYMTHHNRVMSPSAPSPAVACQ